MIADGIGEERVSRPCHRVRRRGVRRQRDRDRRDDLRVRVVGVEGQTVAATDLERDHVADRHRLEHGDDVLVSEAQDTLVIDVDENVTWRMKDTEAERELRYVIHVYTEMLLAMTESRAFQSYCFTIVYSLYYS